MSHITVTLPDGSSRSVPEGTSVRFRYLAENDHWSNETDHPDAHEGMLAFAEKRKPNFQPPQ